MSRSTPRTGPSSLTLEASLASRGQLRAVWNSWYPQTDTKANTVERHKFCFDDAPTITLCMALLELEADSNRCGVICLFLCDRLSSFLSLGSIDEHFVLNSIRRLACHAKLKFFHAGMSSKVEVAQSYLARTDVLRLLLVNGCGPIPSLVDLATVESARKLRDSLIENDRMDLALEVCLRGIATHVLQLCFYVNYSYFYCFLTT